MMKCPNPVAQTPQVVSPRQCPSGTIFDQVGVGNRYAEHAVFVFFLFMFSAAIDELPINLPNASQDASNTSKFMPKHTYSLRSFVRLTIFFVKVLQTGDSRYRL
jgi:hypothetical protein